YLTVDGHSPEEDPQKPNRLAFPLWCRQDLVRRGRTWNLLVDNQSLIHFYEGISAAVLSVLCPVPSKLGVRRQPGWHSCHTSLRLRPSPQQQMRELAQERAQYVS